MVRVVEIEAEPILFDEKMKKPQKYARNKKWKHFQKFFEADKKALMESFDLLRNTAIHVAARSDDTKLLIQLLELLSASERWHVLRRKNDHKNTLLHEVAYYCSNVEVADVVFKYETETPSPEEMSDESEESKRPLLELTNDAGETPVFRAAKHGNLGMQKHMARRALDLQMHIHRDSDKTSILHVAVLGQYFEAAIWLLTKVPDLANLKDDRGLTCLQILSKMPYVFRSQSRLGNVKGFIYQFLPEHGYHRDEEDDTMKIISSSERDLESGENQSNKPISAISRINYAIWKFLAKEWDEIDDVWHIKKQHKLAEQLANLLVKRDLSWMKTFVPKRRTLALVPEAGPSNNINREASSHKHEIDTPLLLAASAGIAEIVESIVNMNPEALNHISEDEENILHVVIKHRQLKLYRILRKYGALEQLAHQISNNGRTPLHKAASLEKYKDGNHSGDAFELQDELQWFHQVRKIIPPYFIMQCDDNNLTARQLFDKEHSVMLKDAQNWIKETAQSCSAVAVLVATVVFAAAYTVPGGTEASGYPILLQSPLFLFFTVMDIVALACSLTSVAMFLSILTSPFEMDEFYKSLPRKLTLGFTMLFLSLTTTMLAFSATILLTVKLKKKWTSTLIYGASFFPVAIFGLMQFPLYMAVQSRLKQLLRKFRKLIPRRLMKSKKRIKRLYR